MKRYIYMAVAVIVAVFIGNWLWRRYVRREERLELEASKAKFESRDRVGFAAELARSGATVTV